jgi:hypothetical protein
MADGPVCKKHNKPRVATQVGKNKLWALTCPDCQAGKAGAAPPAAPPVKPATAPASDAPAPEPEKKTSKYESGFLYSRRVKE